jgi:uncharacterized protein YjbJ (UPF0337 family)
MVMGTLKGIAEKVVGKAKEAVAGIIGDGKLREEAKAQQKARQRKAEDETSESGGLKPLGNLDRLT